MVTNNEDHHKLNKQWVDRLLDLTGQVFDLDSGIKEIVFHPEQSVPDVKIKGQYDDSKLDHYSVVRALEKRRGLTLQSIYYETKGLAVRSCPGRKATYKTRLHCLISTINKHNKVEFDLTGHLSGEDQKSTLCLAIKATKGFDDKQYYRLMHDTDPMLLSPDSSRTWGDQKEILRNLVRWADKGTLIMNFLHNWYHVNEPVHVERTIGNGRIIVNFSLPFFLPPFFRLKENDFIGPCLP